jgi:UDP-glucose 4-epimerase
VTWLLTGGAGYIGAHLVLAFREAGFDVVVIDDLSTGYRGYVDPEVPFVEGSVADADVVARTLDEYDVHGIVHLAGLKYAGVSVQQPLAFYHANVTGMQVLLEAAVERNIDRFLFSSSASWYGSPDTHLVDEDTQQNPESPYGQTKVASEWLLRDVAATRPSLGQTSLRYFNVVGSGRPELADLSPHNLFPKVFRALSAGEPPVVNGTDYPTPDGSCIRDYVHVVDVADAHVVAARRLDAGAPCAPAYNVGRGVGSSVLDVMHEILRVAGSELNPSVRPRRPGDPAQIVGAVDRIERDFGWRARLGLADMVQSAWTAWQHQLDTFGGEPPVGATTSGTRFAP